MTSPIPSGASAMPAQPDITIDVRETFGIDVDWQVPAFSQRDEHVPETDGAMSSIRTRPWRSSPALPTTAG